MKIKVFTAFSGYDSQCMALDRLKEDCPDFDYELVGWSEIDKYAIQMHDAVYPQWAGRNYGDISKIDWVSVPDFDFFTFSFPCFTGETLILTKQGFKEIQDVTEDDMVLTHTDQYQRVTTSMVKAFKGELYTIKAMAIDKINCTPEHPFYVRKRLKKWNNSIRRWHRLFESPTWVNAKDLTKDHYLGIAINQESKLPNWSGVEDNRWGHHRNSDMLSDLFMVESFWYLMGRYIGDGWKRVGSNGKGIVICCGGRNEDKLIQAMEECNYHYVVANERTVRKYHICSNELHKFCERYGYYADGKMIDGETLDLPTHLLKAFLDGCFDSDGYKTKDGYIKYASVSKMLIYGIAQCIAKVYHRPYSIYHTPRKPQTIIEGRVVNQQDSYTVVFKEQSNKQDKAFYEEGYLWCPIQSITHEYQECDVYNMSVAEDESYTANGIIVHNCTDISNAGQQKGLAKGSGTRSSLLWECCRAIETKKPKYLFMENVKALVSDKFKPFLLEFEQWVRDQGYSVFHQVLNAKDYGIPQNRERLFMIGIREENAQYEFPKPFPLKSRLKDVLEENVDEKYYISDKMLEYFERVNSDTSHGHNFTPKDGDDLAFALRTGGGSRVDENYIKDDGI